MFYGLFFDIGDNTRGKMSIHLIVNEKIAYFITKEYVVILTGHTFERELSSVANIPPLTKTNAFEE